MEKPSEDYSRLAVNISAEAAEVLRGMASRRGMTYTELVRRAIACLHIFDEAERSGKTIVVRGRFSTKRIDIF